jgi:hypothetical protein
MPRLLESDFVQGYLQGLALRRGISPYLPIPELSVSLLGQGKSGINPHPSPYTPFVAALFFPLSAFPPIRLREVWVALSALSGYAGIFVLGAFALPSFRHLRAQLLFVTCMIFSAPGVSDLRYGQWNFILFFLSSLAFISLRQRKDFLCGIFLGVMLSLKLFGWPFLLIAILAKRIRVALGVISSAGAIVAMSLMVVGTDDCLRWLTVASPQVSQMWGFVHDNFSLLTLFARTVRPETINFVDGRAILNIRSDDPHHILLTSWVAGGAAIIVLMVMLAKLIKRNPELFSVSFPTICMFSAITNPVAWDHYFLAAFLPLAVEINRIFILKRFDWRAMQIGGIILPLLLINFNVVATSSIPPVGFDVPIGLWSRLVLCVPTFLCALCMLVSFEQMRFTSTSDND